MAWISLVIVSLFLYTPVVGLASRIVENDIFIKLPLPFLSIGINIPFTGPLRLIIVSLISWITLWGSLQLIENLSHTDILKRLGIRNDLFYAFRPEIAIGAVTFLAKLILLFATFKAITTILLMYLINQVIPWIASLVAGEFAPFVQPILSKLLRSFVNFDYGIVYVVFSIFILIVNSAYRSERRKRLERDHQFNQQVRRKSQTNIVIPVTQD